MCRCCGCRQLDYPGDVVRTKPRESSVCSVKGSLLHHFLCKGSGVIESDSVSEHLKRDAADQQGSSNWPHEPDNEQSQHQGD